MGELSPRAARTSGAAPERESNGAEPSAARYVAQNVRAAVVSLLLLVVVMALAGRFFQEHLRAFAAAIEQRTGMPGLSALVFVTDTLISPVPPDLALLVVAQTHLRAHGWWFAPVLGLVSSLAGVAGYLLASRLRDHPIVQRLTRRFRAQQGDRIARFGWIAVALGAVTPLPFSLTCWTAALLNVRLRSVAVVCLLRVPRFVVYYWVILEATAAGRGL